VQAPSASALVYNEIPASSWEERSTMLEMLQTTIAFSEKIDYAIINVDCYNMLQLFVASHHDKKSNHMVMNKIHSKCARVIIFFI
jgi:hypothetical protein